MTNTNKTPGIKYSELVSSRARITLDVRLLSRAVKNDKTGCLEFNGNNDKYGYGRIKIKERQLGAHRASYVVFIEDIPPNMVVMHKCDNPCCINPDHLKLGTQKENISDSIFKGRFFSKIKKDGKPLMYERGDYFSPICVYNDHVSVIYRNPTIAIMEGFNQGAIYSVLNGKSKTTKGYHAYYLQQATA